MYGTCEIDWAKANFSTIYKSYIVSIFICCFFLPVTVMVFSYVSIINTVKLSHALTGLNDPTDRQRRMERDVTRVSVVSYWVRFISVNAVYPKIKKKRTKENKTHHSHLISL